MKFFRIILVAIASLLNGWAADNTRSAEATDTVPLLNLGLWPLLQLTGLTPVVVGLSSRFASFKREPLTNPDSAAP